jgi:hypothetical protein
MSARADHTANEKTEMRDTLRFERDALLDEQEGWFIYTEIVPTKRPELVRAMSGMGECARQRCVARTENCKGKLLVTKD